MLRKERCYPGLHPSSDAEGEEDDEGDADDVSDTAIYVPHQM